MTFGTIPRIILESLVLREIISVMTSSKDFGTGFRMSKHQRLLQTSYLLHFGDSYLGFYRDQDILGSSSFVGNNFQ